MNYLKFQDISNKLLKKFGQTITLILQTQGTYNVATGTISVVKNQQTVIGAVFDWGTLDRPGYGENWIGNGLVQTNDRQLLISALGIIPPNLGDMVVIGASQYTIIPPLKIEAPAGIPVFIVCGIRGI